MSSSKHSNPEPERQEDHRNERDQDGGSGEGAASALAHLKRLARQHRHEAGESTDRSEGGSA